LRPWQPRTVYWACLARCRGRTICTGGATRSSWRPRGRAGRVSAGHSTRRRREACAVLRLVGPSVVQPPVFAIVGVTVMARWAKYPKGCQFCVYGHLWQPSDLGPITCHGRCSWDGLHHPAAWLWEGRSHRARQAPAQHVRAPSDLTSLDAICCKRAHSAPSRVAGDGAGPWRGSSGLAGRR
jgi:hypothetical protein